MLLYLINDLEEILINKLIFVNFIVFYILNYIDYIRREREGRMEVVRGDWFYFLLLLILVCFVIVVVRFFVGLYYWRILF